MSELEQAYLDAIYELEKEGNVFPKKIVREMASKKFLWDFIRIGRPDHLKVACPRELLAWHYGNGDPIFSKKQYYHSELCRPNVYYVKRGVTTIKYQKDAELVYIWHIGCDHCNGTEYFLLYNDELSDVKVLEEQNPSISCPLHNDVLKEYQEKIDVQDLESWDDWSSRRKRWCGNPKRNSLWNGGEVIDFEPWSDGE